MRFVFCKIIWEVNEDKSDLNNKSEFDEKEFSLHSSYLSYKNTNVVRSWCIWQYLQDLDVLANLNLKSSVFLWCNISKLDMLTLMKMWEWINDLASIHIYIRVLADNLND